MTTPSLPIQVYLPEIKRGLQTHSSLVLEAPPGSGKTTLVPPFLMEHGFAKDGLIVMLQPRRVAARAGARRMAEIVGEPLGKRIGYQIRFERKMTRETKILVVTEGVLAARILADPMLEGIACVILDEFHERSIHTDLAIACLREMQEIRDDLKLLVMSATLRGDKVAAYLNRCPILRVPGRPYPLTITYRDTPTRAGMIEAIGGALQELATMKMEASRDILVFLPGAGEIRRAIRELAPRFPHVEMLPLYGALSREEQDLVFVPGRTRRVIFTTNIAETSLTIPGVGAVVDSGLKREVVHDLRRGIDRLDTVFISQASAAQRAGRAGRLGPGLAIRLWSEERHHLLTAHDAPEIFRADLSLPLLSIFDFHGPDLDRFPFFERPPQEAIHRACRLLFGLECINGDGRITEKGRVLSRFPLHPRLGAMLYQAQVEGAAVQGARLCAVLSEYQGLWSEMAAYALNGDARCLTKASGPVCRRVENVARQLERMNAGEHSRQTPKGAGKTLDEAGLARLLLCGYSDRLCRRKAPGQGLMVGGRGVRFEGEGHPFFLAFELSDRGPDRITSIVDQMVPVDLETLLTCLPVEEREQPVFDEGREAVSARKSIFFHDLELVAHPGQFVDEEQVAKVLAAAAVNSWQKVFKPAKEEVLFFARLSLANHLFPEKQLPPADEQGLRDHLEEICFGLRRFEDLRRFSWADWARARLSWQDQQWLDRVFPPVWTAPSGSRISIDYAQALGPQGHAVIAVRLQEVFGLDETPQLAEGRLPVLFHLLAPNMRPVQMTRDLKNFWNTTYSEVRKELRQRYPKHAWPENPWQAAPIRGVPRKRKG